MCRELAAIGFTFTSSEYPHFGGGYGEYVCLPDARFPVFKTDLTPEAGAVVIPCAEALNTIDTVKVQRGEVVVVQGVGLQGLMSIAWASALGAGRIIALGAPARRLEIAKELGADEVIDITEVSDSDERIRRVVSSTPGGFGADVVVQCTGARSALSEGLAFARDGGRMIDVGHASDVGDFSVNVAREMVTRGVHLLSGWGCTPERVWRAVEFLERGEFDWGSLISHKLPLERLGDALEAMEGAYDLDGREVVRIAIEPGQRD